VGNSVREHETTAVSDLLDLSREQVLVTGASGNIGQAIAARLAEAGARIIAHYHHNEAAAEALIAKIGGGRAVFADLTDESSVSGMLESADATMVVNNAAVQTLQSLGEMSFSEWQVMMTTNLDSVFLVTQRVATAWSRAGRGGSIVNIGSIEGLDPASGHGHYATSKAGLLMLSRAAALEYGQTGIRINSVSPGLIDREGLAQEWPEGVDRWCDRAPLGRVGTPNDVADAVLFLLSPAARWISGANLVVDGGMSTNGKW
jgi:NAD(P)-dependent dehydrogenase (short-subunit alcohol dehydrogenase family)